MMRRSQFKPGDPVVYRVTKYTARPGPRARDVHPAASGEDYTYTVDKFWVVEKVCEDGTLMLRTRRGKQHRVSPDDPQLRRAGLLERVIYRRRFPASAALPTPPPPT